MAPNNERTAEFRSNQAPPVQNRNRLWSEQAIDENLWNQYLPYQLLLVKVDNSGDKPSYSPLGAYRFTLPISPQEFSWSMPIATNVQATLTGIAETHGGAPFRDISLVGTTGITPLRGTAASGRSTDTGSAVGKTVAGIFAGTVDAATRVATSANQITNGAATFPNLNDSTPSEIDGPTSLPTRSTGYYQYLMLQRFIENYVEIKSQNTFQQQLNVHAKDIRLAFAVYKESAAYLVSGVQLARRKSATTDPHLFNFTLNLKAWARVSLVGGQGPFGVDHQFVARKPNLVAQLFNRMRDAREGLDAVSDTLRAVVGDATNVLDEALRQTALFMKSTTGVAYTMRDLPVTIQRESIPLIRKDWDQLRSQFKGIISPELDQELLDSRTAGLTSSGSALNNNGATNDPTNPGLKKVLDAIAPSSLKFKAATLAQINVEINKSANLNRFDFAAMRDSLRQVSDQFTFAVGAGDETYARTYGLTFVPSTREPTRTEFDVMFGINEILQVFDSLAASGTIDPPSATSLEYVAGLAEASGVAFKIPQSKYAVPFPYGSTLERLALRYLGDANRWHEIATLNGLRAPYIDENGFSLPLITNGDRHTIQVADATNLYVGQTAWLSANGVLRSKRHITRVDKVAEGNYLVDFDGLDDLQSFTTPRQAKLEAFTPGTVNSQQVIYIPSENVTDQDPELRAVPGVDAFDPYLQIGGIDLLLTPDGDLAMTPDGDCKLAFGLTNIVQTVKLALATAQGSLLQHPDYGLKIPVGISNADFSPEQLLAATKDLFNNDPSFTGVKSASVVENGNTVSVTLEIGITGISKYLPVTIDVKRQG